MMSVYGYLETICILFSIWLDLLPVTLLIAAIAAIIALLELPFNRCKNNK